MKDFLKNPIIAWFSWYVRSRKQMSKNKSKHLKLHNMAQLINVETGLYNTIYKNTVLVNCKLSDFVYVSEESILKNTTIGKFCSIGPGIRIGLGMHPTNFVSTFPAFFSTYRQCQVTFSDKNYFEEIGTVEIGNDVWIGANAVVMDNVKVGDGSIVAAGAVVVKDVPPYAIVGGVPAKVIKYRFDDETIAQLLESKWWDKDLSFLAANANKMTDPKDFLRNL